MGKKITPKHGHRRTPQKWHTFGLQVSFQTSRCHRLLCRAAPGATGRTWMAVWFLGFNWSSYHSEGHNWAWQKPEVKSFYLSGGPVFYRVCSKIETFARPFLVEASSCILSSLKVLLKCVLFERFKKKRVSPNPGFRAFGLHPRLGFSGWFAWSV